MKTLDNNQREQVFGLGFWKYAWFELKWRLLIMTMSNLIFSLVIGLTGSSQWIRRSWLRLFLKGLMSLQE